MADDPFANAAYAQTTQQQPHIYRPIPRRNFSSNSRPSDSPSDQPWPQQHQHQQQSPPSSLHDPHSRSSDFLTQLNARLLRTYNSNNSIGNIYENGDSGGPLTRNKSFLNMTSSTLFGIYDDVGSSTADERSMAETPWGTGAETPSARSSIESGMGLNSCEGRFGSLDGGLKMKGLARSGTMDAQRQRPRLRHGARPRRRGAWKYAVITAKLFALFLFGVVYGIIVSHLHDTRELAAVRVAGIGRESWIYLASWGLAGMVLGSLLPYVDLVWDGDAEVEDTPSQGRENQDESESSLWEQWNDVARSFGAFVGIAFAIRRLPWQSTLQLTLTLALVNPALWYILDRSRTGISVSLTITSILTSFIFLSNPDVLPSPSLPATTTNSTHVPSSNMHAHQEELFAGVVSYENLAVVTWVGSVLFCSCVCFGNIGRRLAVLDGGSWKR
ncbi:hypothetical protein K504DRAFT_458576 [Pleomassaria siparia CBS 279.74]|uniref:INSIG domain-containing protein n=1 Tax=Pleomassaria siparia CBS 279.74 TaxID=1314801 RepID=A0A6G1K302_9PLEO|nr:hypothetical protein K504DRAFT_458576 [Pleomassaria siparia CBS 279.74]